MNAGRLGTTDTSIDSSVFVRCWRQVGGERTRRIAIAVAVVWLAATVSLFTTGCTVVPMVIQRVASFAPLAILLYGGPILCVIVTRLIVFVIGFLGRNRRVALTSEQVLRWGVRGWLPLPGGGMSIASLTNGDTLWIKAKESDADKVHERFVDWESHVRTWRHWPLIRMGWYALFCQGAITLLGWNLEELSDSPNWVTLRREYFPVGKLCYAPLAFLAAIVAASIMLADAAALIATPRSIQLSGGEEIPMFRTRFEVRESFWKGRHLLIWDEKRNNSFVFRPARVFSRRDREKLGLDEVDIVRSLLEHLHQSANAADGPYRQG